MEHITEYDTIVKAIVPAIPNSTTVTAVEVDASGGYDRVLYIIQTGAIAATATLDMKVQEAAATGMGSAADITSAAITQVVSGGASKVYTIDVPVNKAKPFQKLVGTAGVSTVAVSAIAILYNGTRTLPPANSGLTQNVQV